MSITMIQLECFLEAVKCRSFSSAAANLYMSQPTLSRHIQALEEELCAPLFVRANNAIRLSGIGQEIFPKLEEMYHTIQSISADLHKMVDQHSSRLRIGVLASLRIEPALRSAVNQMRRRFPDCQIQLCHLDLRQSYDALMDSSVDILISLNASMPPSDKVHSTPLREDCMCLAVPRDHPNASLAYIAYDEIERMFPELPYTVLDVTEFEAPVQQDLKNAQPNYADKEFSKVSGPFASLDTLLLMVDAGLCTACVNESGIINTNPSVKLIPLIEHFVGGIRHNKIYINMYWIDKNQNPMLKAFFRIWEEYASNESASSFH